MGSYVNKRMIIESDSYPEKVLNQFLECYGYEIDNYGSLNDINCDYYEDLDSIYAIASVAFGNIHFYYEYSEGHTVSDGYSGDEIDYNENNDGKKKEKSYDYCYGEFLSNGENGWYILKNEIETEAKKRKIKIKWENSRDDIYPSGEEGDDFYELCSEILEKHGDLEGLSTREKTSKIKKIEVDQDKIMEIIENAKNKNYLELVE